MIRHLDFYLNCYLHVSARERDGLHPTAIEQNKAIKRLAGCCFFGETKNKFTRHHIHFDKTFVE